MEELGLNADFWRDRRVLLTGHTGFKGSWLSLWLHSLGAKVFGFALDPDTEPALFSSARLDACMQSMRGDVRDAAAVRTSFMSTEPEIVIHMAAQSLVRRSYAQPVETFATNVMGTVHVLDEARRWPTAAVLVITSDKCYDERNSRNGYREDDPLGGRDPYSASKAAQEIIARAYRDAYASIYPRPAIATARSGNVIGGGDWAEDRLLPDVIRAWTQGRFVTIRNPTASRPWQHVLDPLAGYLSLCERLAASDPRARGAWNFGPSNDQSRTVKWVVERASAQWGNGANWLPGSERGPAEVRHLRLDTSKARRELDWHPRLSTEEALMWTMEWYRSYYAAPMKARELCEAQIDRYGGLKPQ